MAAGVPMKSRSTSDRAKAAFTVLIRPTIAPKELRCGGVDTPFSGQDKADPPTFGIHARRLSVTGAVKDSADQSESVGAGGGLG